MKTLRPKAAQYGKPFRIFQKKQEFNRLDGPDQDMIISRAEIEKKPEPKKEEIIRPKIEIVSAPSRGSNLKGLPLNYIRLTSELNLPRSDTYEISEVDYIFLIANENKYLFGGKKVLTAELLEKCFVYLEVLTGKDFSTLPKTLKPRFKTFLEEQLDVMSKMDKFDEFVDLLYNRWRGRREELKYPLLRQLWRPSNQDSSHYLAFRPREKRDKDKRTLRRPTKFTEDDMRYNIDVLMKELEKSKEITERVVARQKFKLAMFNLDLQRFNIQARGFKDEPLFVKQVDKKEIVKLKDDYQKLKNEYQAQKEAEKLENVIESSIIAEDSKAAVCNFIANLSSLANQANIDWESLSSLNPRPLPSPSPIVVYDPVKSTQSPTVVIPPLSSNICKFNVEKIINKDDQYLQRNFDPIFQEPKSQRSHEQTNRFFLVKHKGLCRNYFFQDEDDEGRDIKRSISVSFKKFMASKVL